MTTAEQIKTLNDAIEESQQAKREAERLADQCIKTAHEFGIRIARLKRDRFELLKGIDTPIAVDKAVDKIINSAEGEVS